MHMRGEELAHSVGVPLVGCFGFGVNGIGPPEKQCGALDVKKLADLTIANNPLCQKVQCGPGRVLCG